MIFKELEIPGVKLLTLERHSDVRGWLNETWRNSWNNDLNLNINFTQDMWSFNEHKNTLRGLHSLKKTAAQHKLVTVLRGKVFDVVVDLRIESPTYKKYLSVILSEDIPCSILMPPGCYHGYLTLTDNVVLGYKVDQYYSDELNLGIRWDDPEINISWPADIGNVIISDKDKNLPLISQL